MAEHFGRNVADPLAAERGVPLEVDAAPEVEQRQCPAVVHRQGEAVAGDPGLRAQRAVDGLAQRDGHVLHRVVFVDVQIAPRVDGQRDAAVVGDLREHVVQKAQARGDLAVEIPAAVEVEADGDLRLAGLAPDFGPAFAAADEFGDFAPRVGDQRTGVGGAGFLQRPQPFGGGSEQDAPRPEVAGQQDVGRAVADDVARREVVFAARVAAEHPCPGFARGGGVGLERAVDQLVVERDALAAERREHFVMRRPKGILGEGRGAEPVLVGGQHEVEPEARERLQGGDGSGYEREFFEAVDLFVGGFGDDRAVAVDEEGFFHNRKFLTVSIIRAFSAGVPTVMRRHPSQPGMRERLRTMTPAEISASYMRSGSGVRTRMKLASEG